MKTGKIIGGVLGCLMLCGLLAGCSGNNADSASNVPSTYQKGAVTEHEFTSEWMGIKYTLPSDMTMLSEETLAKGSNDSIQMEMQARKNDGLNDNIAMLAENLSKDPAIDVEGYLELVKSQMEKVIPGVTFGEAGTRTIAGQEFSELPYSYTKEVEGTQVTMNQILLCRKIEYRMICITITYSNEDSIAYLLSGFSEV